MSHPHDPTVLIEPGAPLAVRRVGLLGGESAGKTTLAEALAGQWGAPWVPEYGRERWLEIGGTFSLDELLAVAQIQVAREEAATIRARDWLVCDTTPLTTLVYALIDHGQAPPELWALARRRYDLLVLCAPDFDFVQDGARRDAAFRAEQHALTVRTLDQLGHAWTLVQGPLPARLQQVAALMQAFAPVTPSMQASTSSTY